MLRDEIRKYAPHRMPAIILKIERLSAVQNLPALLINGMKDQALGVMIARGDLAVEIGFERLSEIQEEYYGSVRLRMYPSSGHPGTGDPQPNRLCHKVRNH